MCCRDFVAAVDDDDNYYDNNYVVGMLVSRPTIRLLQCILGQTGHGCINHNIVVVH